MLESKVDINLKIAKILSDAMGWTLACVKGNKFSVSFPVQALTGVAPQEFSENALDRNDKNSLSHSN